MKRFLITFSLLMLLTAAVAATAEATSTTCLPGGFPSTPTGTVTSRDLASGFGSNLDRFHIDIWRVPCQDASGQVALLLRATPITSAPFVCAIDFTMLQGGAQIGGPLQTAGGSSFCSDLLVATTFSLERRFSSDPPFDNIQAFTLDYNQGPNHVTLEVPGAGPMAPAPPSVQVVITGCPCRPGTLSTIKLVYTNPGPAQTIDLRFGAHFPDGSGLAVLNDFLALPAGASEAVLLQGPIPSTPTGTYHLEAALLDPIFGVTLSRHSAALQIVP